MVAYLGGIAAPAPHRPGLARARHLPPPAASPTLTVLEVHEAFDAIAALAGPAPRPRGPPR